MRRPPRPLQPTGVQLAYLAALLKVIRTVGAAVRERLVARLPDLLERHAAVFRGDATHPPGKRVNSILSSIRQRFEANYPQPRLERVAEKAARATADHQKRQLQRQLKAQVGVELGKIADRGLTARIKQFTAENVSLIRSLPRDYLAEVEQRTLAAIRAGARHEDLADELEERLGVAEERAKLIARDQVLKFQGALNEVRQTDLGIDRYVWRTVEDERVRSEHVERDGEVYAWDEPPGDDPEDPATGGHPGQAIRCRCWAEPIIEGEGDEDAEAQGEG